MAEAAEKDDQTVDDKTGNTDNTDQSTDGNTDDAQLPDYLEEVIIQGLDGDEDQVITPDAIDTKDDKDDKDFKANKTDTKDSKPTPADKGDKDAKPTVEDLNQKVTALLVDKTNLQKALHEHRQKAKSLKAAKDDKDDPLTEAQLIKIYEENKDDPKTLLRIVAHQAEQAAMKASSKVVLDSDIKKKVKEADGILSNMYPKLNEEGSDIRLATDETKSFYNIDEHPFGDFFAMGIQVLNALPNLLEAAEKRGESTALNTKADGTRKKDIKANQTQHGKKPVVKGGDLSNTEAETAKQMNLSPGAFKTYQKLVGNKQSKHVQVKE